MTIYINFYDNLHDKKYNKNIYMTNSVKKYNDKSI